MTQKLKDSLFLSLIAVAIILFVTKLYLPKPEPCDCTEQIIEYQTHLEDSLDQVYKYLFLDMLQLSKDSAKIDSINQIKIKENEDFYHYINNLPDSSKYDSISELLNRRIREKKNSIPDTIR